MGIFQKGKNCYIDYYIKGRRKRKKIGPSKKLAMQVLKDVQLKIAKGEYLGVYEEKKIPFDKYAEQYLNYSKANKAWSSYRRDRFSINKLASFFKGKYVFSNRDGHPFKDIKKGFSSDLKRAGIKDFRFHDLRHTFGSHLVMQGVGLRTVQQLMGHKEIRMTMHYSHLSPEYVQKAVKRLDNLWTLFGHQSKSEKPEDSVNH